MALIIDPDNLSQGASTAVPNAVFGTPTGNTVTITSGTSALPAMAAGDFIEVRDHSNPVNNGLYVETGGSPTTASITVDKLTGSAPAAAGSEAITTLGSTATKKNVHFDTNGKQVWLLEKGALSVDGVTMLALHSFMKEEWKADAFLVAASYFPMIGISFAAGQWQFGVDPSGNFHGWKPAENIASPVAVQTRRLIRNAGWDELDANGNTLRKYFNVTTLGTFEDSVNDLAYYRFGTDSTDTGSKTNFEFAGPVNEPVLYFREFGNPPTCTFATSSTITRASGSFITDGYKVGGRVTIRAATNPANDGTFVLTAVAATTLTVTGTPFVTGADTAAQLAVDNANVFTSYLRVRDADPNGKTFSQASLSDGGETGISSKIIKLPLSNATDLDISETDANIAANSPYTQIVIRYFSQAFTREVDSATPRNFGIVVDVGTHSGVDGAIAAAGTVLTTTEGGMGVNAYAGGTLRIHEGTDANTTFNIASNTATTITITGGTFTATESNISFTAQRSAPVTASKKQIYEKIQYQLRQNADIDATGGTVIGSIADALAVFVGPDLKLGRSIPTNPKGGGSGVIVEGFDTNDTNNLQFFDNTAVERAYPFVAAGTLTFNQLLVDDTDGEYWLYFQYTTRTTSTTADVTAPSGSTYTLTGASDLPALSVNDYIDINGFAQEANNGLFIVTAVNVSTSSYNVRKVDGTAVGTTETDQTITVDENPFPSPQAIIVNNNAGSPLAAAINTLTIGFDFDYDNNTQGGRTPATNAVCVLMAAGFETAQVAVTRNLTISRATGLNFSVTAARERNYDNPV